MLVKDIMSRGIRTVHPDTALLEVSSLMCLYRLSGLPVMEDKKLVGFVAEKDVLSRLFPSLSDFRDGMLGVDYAAMDVQYKEVMHLKTADIMATRVVSVSPDMHALQATGDQLEKMLSLGDVHKALFHANVARR